MTETQTTIEKQFDRLLDELGESQKAWADAFLTARRYEKGMSIDDSRATAILRLAEIGVRLPEVVRFELHFIAGVTRSVEPD